jgi:putative transposase
MGRGKPYSMDLRERVVAAVDKGGLSCHPAAAQFGVGVNTAILWVRRFRETGSVAPGQMGGRKPKRISGKHRDWLLERTKARDFTLRGLVTELAERELKVDLLFWLSHPSCFLSGARMRPRQLAASVFIHDCQPRFSVAENWPKPLAAYRPLSR